MAKIPITSGFTLIPEGFHIFKITDVTYQEDFGKLEIKMVTSKGQKHSERFSLLDGNGEPNEKACNAFSYFAKNALNQFDVDEIDHTDLVGHYIKAEITHTQLPSTKKPGEFMTFANLGDKYPADGFEDGEDEPKAASTPAPTPKKGGKPNLDDLLG